MHIKPDLWTIYVWRDAFLKEDENIDFSCCKFINKISALLPNNETCPIWFVSYCNIGRCHWKVTVVGQLWLFFLICCIWILLRSFLGFWLLTKFEATSWTYCVINYWQCGIRSMPEQVGLTIKGWGRTVELIASTLSSPRDRRLFTAMLWWWRVGSG
jgi:hypothetical protein